MDFLPDQPGFEGGKVLNGSAPISSSPALADLNNDGKEEIIVGGADGMVYAVSSSGTLLWQFNAGGAISAAAPSPGGGLVDTTPAVADLDGDGTPEVVVGVVPPSSDLANHNGGLVVLSHNGVLEPGWPQVTFDNTHDGFAEGIFSSPAIGDLDGDGDLEIVAAGWDMRTYAWHHDGQLVDGWPRFAAEVVFSSPALADLDNDGLLEVIIGYGASDYPPMYMTKGGYLHVYRHDGTEMAGFPKHIDQTVDSSPAIGDINGDGSLDIVVGTSSFYPGVGYAIYAWDRYGNALPGWPVATSGYVSSSPALGDIDGDGLLEVIVGCNDGKLYALNGDGSHVPGWPVIMQDNMGNVGSPYWASPVLGNFDGDSLPEVFINCWCDTIVLNGNGTYLTHRGDNPDGKPTIWMGNNWCPFTTPAIGDIDDDGKLEIVRTGGNDLYNHGNLLLRVWESDRTPATTAWPMFRRDSAHHALARSIPSMDAQVVSHDLPDILLPGATYQAHITLKNTGTATWTEANLYRLAAFPDDPLAVQIRACLNPGESIAPGQQRTFTIQLQAPNQPGYYVTTWRMLREGVALFGQAVSHQIKVGNEPAFQVLYKSGGGQTGGVYPGGLASTISSPPDFDNWWAARSLGFVPEKPNQYFLLDNYATIWCGGMRDCFGSWAPWGTATQEILMLDHATTFYVLDKYGAIYNGSGAYSISPPPPTFSDPRVRSAALTPDGRGIYVLDGYGNVYTGGNAPPLSGTPGFAEDIAKRIKLTADGTGYYVLDAYGRVWNGGMAPAITPNYTCHLSEDWARDFELTADGKGYYLLDKEGHIYTGGTAVAPTNLPPICPGQDVAVDLALADSRILNGLVATPDALTLMTTPGQPRSTSVYLSEYGAASINWLTSKDRSWLRVNPGSGSTPSSLVVSVDSTGLGIGQYQGNVTIQSQEAVNSPISVPVQVLVAETIHAVYLPLVSR